MCDSFWIHCLKLAHFCSKFQPFLSHIVTGKAPPQKRFSLHPNQILLGNMSQLNAASAELLSQAYKFENNLSLQTTNQQMCSQLCSQVTLVQLTTLRPLPVLFVLAHLAALVQQAQGLRWPAKVRALQVHRAHKRTVTRSLLDRHSQPDSPAPKLKPPMTGVPSPWKVDLHLSSSCPQVPPMMSCRSLSDWGCRLVGRLLVGLLLSSSASCHHLSPASSRLHMPPGAQGGVQHQQHHQHQQHQQHKHHQKQQSHHQQHH